MCASCGDKPPVGQKDFLGTGCLGVCLAWAGDARLQVLGLELPVPARPLKPPCVSRCVCCDSILTDGQEVLFPFINSS